MRRKKRDNGILILLIVIVYLLVNFPFQTIIFLFGVCVFIICKRLYKQDEEQQRKKVIRYEVKKQPKEICSTEIYKQYVVESEYERKGREAEEKIAKKLAKIFGSQNVIHDSYFINKNQKSTQVDVIAVNQTGIYVIESKDYSGVVRGSEKSRKWCQLLNKTERHFFLNPILQNAAHIDAIKRNLEEFDIPEEAYKSYIVFGNGSKLDLGNIQQAKVLQVKDLFYSVVKDGDNTPNILNEQQVEKVAIRIKNHTQVSMELKIHHKERLTNKSQ